MDFKVLKISHLSQCFLTYFLFQEFPFNFPKISYENQNIWSSLSKDIISPFAPKFPFYDVNNYIAEPVKKYLSNHSTKHIRDSRKKLTMSSSISILDSVVEEKDSPQNQQSEKNQSLFHDFQKERDFFDKIDKRLETNLKKSSKTSKSFDVSILSLGVSTYEKQVRDSLKSVTKFDSRLSLSSELLRTKFLNEKKTTMVFFKNGRNRTLQPLDNDFSEFMDLISIKEEDKKLVSKNCLALRIRRKSDVSFGGLCKKLEKMGCLLSFREKKVSVLNQLIMKGKKEYALERNKDKKLTKCTSFKKVRNVIKNSRLQDIHKGLREVQSKEEIFDTKLELEIKDKSNSLLISPGEKKSEFFNKMHELQQNDTDKKKIKFKREKIDVIASGFHNFKTKIYHKLLKEKYGDFVSQDLKIDNNSKSLQVEKKVKNDFLFKKNSEYFNQNSRRKHFFDELPFNKQRFHQKNENSLKEAVNLTINNSISNTRVRKLFISNENSLPSIKTKIEINSSVSTNSPKFHLDDSYKSYKLEGYKQYLLKQLEKKNKDHDKILPEE